ncbi:MAG: Zn-dependent protease with chaperone function, partial [Myxococcota bacterium]
MTAETTLPPLPYHRAVCDYLQIRETSLWAWLSSPDAREKFAGTVRLQLLKATYRLDPTTHASVYDSVEACRTALGLKVPVTVYQSQDSGAELNAMLLYAPDHAHVVLMGPVLEKLTEAEVRALLAHEIAHHILWSADTGDIFTASRVLAAMSQTSGEPAHANTESRFSRYTELFCDRAGLVVCNDRNVVVSTLVKMSTGMADVSADAYLDQVEEVLNADKKAKSAEGLSHPETFIRARALELWDGTRTRNSDDDLAASKATAAAEAAEAIDALVRGPLDWDGLDILDQVRLDQLTQDLIRRAVTPPWVKQHEAVMAHARMFWANADLSTDTQASDSSASDTKLSAGLSEAVVDYLAYV